jgi:hypothetical protein
VQIGPEGHRTGSDACADSAMYGRPVRTGPMKLLRLVIWLLDEGLDRLPAYEHGR